MTRLRWRRPRPLAVYPFVLSAVFVLDVALPNGVEPAGFVRPLLLATFASMLLTTAVWPIVRSQALAGLLATLVLLALASRKPVIAVLVLIRDSFGAGALPALGVIVIVVVGGLAVGIGVVRRRSLIAKYIRPVTRGLNLFSGVLFTLAVLPALPAIPGGFTSQTREQSGERAPAAAQSPDIYLFLLDGYARADEILRRFGIDESAFIRELGDRGFDVDAGTHSNYTYTALSLTSLLNMDYLSAEPTLVLSRAETVNRLRGALRDGVARQAMHDAGYEFVASAPGWEDVTLRTGADRYLDRPELTDVERLLIEQTWLPDLPPLPSNWFFQELHSRILGILDDAASLAAEQRDWPVFALIHVPAPHLPLGFDRDGNPLALSSRRFVTADPAGYGLTPEQFEAAYAGDIRSLNRYVVETIDSIVSNAERPPVIVVFSDHGYNGDGLPVHDKAMLRNLFAAYTPGHAGLLADSPTPVNLVRLLLSTYAGSALGEPLPDRFFTMVINGNEYRLTEVDDPE